MSKIEIKISSSRPIFIEAEADAFGQVFAEMSSDEQVAVFRSMVEHMKPHRLQWDYIAIELEQDQNRDVREELRAVLFSAEKENVEDLRAEVERHSNAAAAARLAVSEAMNLIYQYRDDMRHPPAPDSRERRVEAIEAMLAKGGRS